MKNLHVSVNLSAKQFHDDLVDSFITILNNCKIDYSFIELEITESIVIQNKENVIKSLNLFRERGIKISLDDFGTGYSSLNYLKDLPIDIVKIDKSFIDDSTANPESRVILKAIIDMAKALNLGIVAEGVETEEQVKLLKSLNSDIIIQGYYFYKPMPAEEVTKQIFEISCL